MEAPNALADRQSPIHPDSESKLPELFEAMPPTPSDESPWVIETTAESFQEDVFERSRSVAVVVDFWAPWCGPCRALGPILERLVGELQGQAILVKANTDLLPEAAGEFGVQGIPAVYAVLNGEVVDFFNGALPESQVRTWLARLVSGRALSAAGALESTDPAAAELAYRKLVEQFPRDHQPQIGLARSLFAQQKYIDAQAVIDELAKRGFLEPEAEKLKAQLDLQRLSGESLAEREAAAVARPDDLPLQLAWAQALAGAAHFEKALEICLHLVQRDRSGVGEPARKLMLEIFLALPADSELTSQYRRKLSMALY